MSIRSIHSGPRRRTGRRLSPARQRVLRAVADLPEDADDGWITLDVIAEHLGGHPNTSRQQLAALSDEHLVEVASFATGRPGRRPQGFRVTSRGRAALADHDQADEYRDMVGAFATYLVQQDPDDVPEKARAIGTIWGNQQAESLRPTRSIAEQPIDGLIEVLDMLGFTPSRTATEQGEAVILSTCPLLDLAEEHPLVICQMHQGMVDAVMRNFGASDGVELLPMADPDGCRVQFPG